MNAKEEKERRLKRLAQWSMVIAAGLAITLVALPAAKMRSNNRDRLVSQGQGLYAQHCAECHGLDGQGQDPNNPGGGRLEDGTYVAPALNGTGAAWYRTNQQLFKYINEGSLDPESPMKAFGKTLSEEEIVAILVYVQSKWPPEVMRQHEANSPDVPRRESGPINF